MISICSEFLTDLWMRDIGAQPLSASEILLRYWTARLSVKMRSTFPYLYIVASRITYTFRIVKKLRCIACDGFPISPCALRPAQPANFSKPCLYPEPIIHKGSKDAHRLTVECHSTISPINFAVLSHVMIDNLKRRKRGSRRAK